MYTKGITNRLKCESASCVCEAFAYIPSRPDEVGEFWLAKRPGFDATSWRAKCKCNHAHDRHESKFKRCKGLFIKSQISLISVFRM
jgi:hypothetical protein